MALVPSFLIAIPAASLPGTFQIQDTSGGSDSAITDRQIILTTVSNTQLVPPIDFPLSLGPFITISPLTQDAAVTIVVTWNSVTGTVLYSSTQVFAFTQFGMAFLYTLVQRLSSTPAIAQDTQFLGNFFNLLALINAAGFAISIGGDVGSAAVCINIYNNILTNQQLYF